MGRSQHAKKTRRAAAVPPAIASPITDVQPRPRLSRRSLALAAGLFVVLAVFWSAPSSLAPFDTLPNLGDPLHLSWVLAWDAHQLPRRPWALFEANAFYPYAHSLTFGDHLLPEALLVAPIFWLTGNAVL